jgi:hypothetical protein
MTRDRHIGKRNNEPALSAKLTAILYISITQRYNPPEDDSPPLSEVVFTITP